MIDFKIWQFEERRKAYLFSKSCKIWEYSFVQIVIYNMWGTPTKQGTKDILGKKRFLVWL